MENVYEQVRLFYEQESLQDAAVKQEWVEGFLRQKAWKGATEADLKAIWKELEMFIAYVVQAANDDLDEITESEYSHAVKWLDTHIPDFKANLKSVRRFFDVLNDFYDYLSAKKYIMSSETMQKAAREIAGGNRLKSIQTSVSPEAIWTGADSGRVIADTVEKLMLKLGGYFQQDRFRQDFDRALFLYTGPVELVPDEEHDEFWLGFWDYFLFDYHLLRDDISPLAHFQLHSKEVQSPEEKRIVQDLLSAEFTVFYISRILNHDWVECRDLFSDRTFELPLPDFEFQKLKKLLFFGHVFSKGTVMINYVISIEVSTNLRKRIHDEIVRLHKLYCVQSKDAVLQDFFRRHALVVRHTIDALLTQSKVIVTSVAQLERKYPQIEEKRKPDSEVAHLVIDLMKIYGFSRHDALLAVRLWHDYSQLAVSVVRKPAAWALAIIQAFCEINMMDNIPLGDMAETLEVSPGSVYRNRSKLKEILELERFDPRYLNEEGFVFLIFMS